MTTLELRSQLKQLIDTVENESLLQYTLRILQGEDQEVLLKVEMCARAQRSEEDIAAGRFFTSKEVRERILNKFGK